MTASEEKLCLKLCQEGDPEAKRILIERNLRLVAHVAKKYQGTGEELEDLISIGTIGLIKAISTFNFERSARLSTYAARCIDNELLMMLRARKKRSKEVSLYEPIGTDKDICCRFGLFGFREMTQREIAEQLQISRSYVSRIEKNALKKLKALFC